MSILIHGTLLGGGKLPGGAQDLSAKVGYWAKTATAVVLSDGDAGIGIIVDGGSTTGDEVGVAGEGCIVQALAGGTLAVGDYVTDNASGLTVVAGTSGMHPRGVALSKSQSGKWVTIAVYKPVDEAIA